MAKRKKKIVSTIDVGEISKMLSERVEAVCKWLLPNGTMIRGYWEVGSPAGEEGKSCKVNLVSKPGLWADFASEEKGDLIELIRAVKSCSLAEAIEEAKAFLGIATDRPKFAKKKKYHIPQKPKCKLPSEEMLQYFEKRGISRETVSAWKVAERHTNFGMEIIWPYYHGQVIKFFKFRPILDKDAMYTSKDSEPILCGWHLVDPDARTLVICEGEIDAMTFYEQRISAVSVPRGGGGGAKQDDWIAAEWDHLECFETIFLALDSDDTGKEGIDQIVMRIGRHRCYIVDFGKYKDANEAHMAGENLWTIVNKQSKVCDPDNLRHASEYIDELVDFVANGDKVLGAPLPWVKTHNHFRMRYGEVTIWGGINGHGKTQVLNHVAVYSMIQGNRWCIASMEMQPKKTLDRMSRQYLGRNKISEKEIREVVCDSFSNMWLYDVQGTVVIDSLLDAFEYAFRRYGCRFFVVDSLSKCGIDEDDYSSQKKAIDQFAAFAMKFDVHVHVVTHVRKDIDEHQIPGKFSIKGTGAITDMVDNVVLVWRNKRKEESRSNPELSPKVLTPADCLLVCCKQRHYDWEGKIGLFYDIHSSQYLENENDRTIDYSTGELNNGTMPNGEQIPF